MHYICFSITFAELYLLEDDDEESDEGTGVCIKLNIQIILFCFVIKSHKTFVLTYM